MSTTLRTSTDTLDKLKLLKSFTQAKTYDDVIKHLVKRELKQYVVHTSTGYVPRGAVVDDRGSILVITNITADRVFFDDGNSIPNGCKRSYELELMAPTVEDYEG